MSEAVGRWEPRVEVDRVDVNDLPGRPGWLRIELGYRLRRTGQIHDPRREPRTLSNRFAHVFPTTTPG